MPQRRRGRRQRGLAAAESKSAVARLQTAQVGDPGATSALGELRRLFTCTDARLASIIERGFHEKLYFVSVGASRLTDEHISGVRQPQERWLPVSSPDQTDVLPLVRHRLRPPPVRLTEPPNAAPARQALKRRWRISRRHEEDQRDSSVRGVPTRPVRTTA